MKTRHVKSFVVALAFACTLPFMGTNGSAAANAPVHLVIAYQPGIGYAPILIMKHTHWIEHDFPQTTVEWRLLTSGAIIRDGIISGNVQIGGLGQGPYFIGWSRGVDWKLLGNVADLDLWLCVMDPKIKSLKDFKPGEQIAMPSPDSNEGTALRKGADDQFNDPHALDSNIVAIPHPQALAALVNGQIAGDFTSPPFQFEEVDRGAHVVFDSHQAFGDTSFTAITMTTSFYNSYPELAAKFLAEMERADKLISSDPSTAARDVAEAVGHPEMTAQYKAWMGRKGITYTIVPSGYLRTAAFLKKIKTINKAPVSITEIELPPLQKYGGS